MDRTRSRKPALKSQTSMAAKATRERFEPAVEWSEDKSSRTLLVLLPGFAREDIRVQIDHNAGKLLIKGSRQASDSKVLVVDQSFDVPKDTIVETISGRFEDGRLTLLMPRKVVEEQEAAQKATTSEEKGKEGKKEEESVQKEAKTSEESRDEAMKKERPATTEEKQEDDKDQETQKGKPATEGEEKDDSPVLEEKSQRGEEKQDEPVEKEKPEGAEGKKKEETIEKMKSRIREICSDKPKEIIKKISNWRGAEGSRLDPGSFDGMLEKLNRNRKVIAVAVVAFSVGFYVSHKLRTRGR